MWGIIYLLGFIQGVNSGLLNSGSSYLWCGHDRDGFGSHAFFFSWVS